ncbi:MAG: insulinase family protein, partial [Planctomycetota bacterium]|nr:insulinase family protein [Planctomycetota bacterium]
MPNIRAILRELFPVGSETSGFQSLHLEEIADLDITAASFSHPQSGAHLLHLATNDPEKLFAIALRTPPPDDTGLPHIIEHSVLCGSRRFPVKDPFVELLKTSMATFLNAFTYPDRTIYPCASLNHADFHNLVQVYCDAVFFPLLREDHFRQEGHHLEITPAGKLILKGVVYNEMRGVYSDPDGILERHIQRLLFAGNAYGNDFGGDPEAISSLTYADYLAFHQRYYHPANAWFFSYGDLDLVRLLQFLDREYLSSFKPISVDSVIQPLPPRLNPESFTFTYPLDQVDSVERKTDIALAMTANDSRDLLETLAMKVVSGYLLDNSASPLRKALIDSKLGDDLGSSGYAD